MIFTERQITVHKGKSSINEPVILYRGDYEVSIKFTIMESKFRFKSGVNLVDSEKASHGQLAILAPYGGNVFSEIVKCEDGTVTFTLTKEMIDQLEEVGLYSFQIRLFDYYRESRVSIPPVEFGIEVREPVASEDHDNEVNNAIVGYSIAKVVEGLNEDVGPTFDADGQYNKTDWDTGDRITEGKLNKIEDALDQINQNEKNDVAALDKKVNSNFNIIQSTKADKNEIFSMANMGQDIKEAMTGGSVAVVGKNAILTENIVDKQIIPEKTNFIDNLCAVEFERGTFSFGDKVDTCMDDTIRSKTIITHDDGLYIVNNSNGIYKYGVLTYDEGIYDKVDRGWLTDRVTYVAKNKGVMINVRRRDGLSINDDEIAYITTVIQIKHNFNCAEKSIVDELYNNTHVYTDKIDFEIGALSNGITLNANNRIRTINFIKVHKNDVILFNDEAGKYNYGVQTYTSNMGYRNKDYGWMSQAEFIVEHDGYVKIVVKYSDGRVITDINFNEISKNRISCKMNHAQVLERDIQEYKNHLDNVDAILYADEYLSSYLWESGTIMQGQNESNNTRIRLIYKYPAKKGTMIKFHKDLTVFKYGINLYDEAGIYNGVDYGWLSVEQFTMPIDGYFRLSLAYVNNQVIDDLSIACNAFTVSSTLKDAVLNSVKNDNVNMAISSISVEYGRINDASYVFVRIPRYLNDGKQIKPIVSLTSEDGSISGTKCSTLTYAKRKNDSIFTLNAGLFNMSTREPVGQLIIDGVSLINTPMNDDNGVPISDMECYPLAIDGDGLLTTYPRNVDTSEMLDDGIKYAVTAWGKLVDNFTMCTEDIANEIVHKDKKYIRQSIGQYQNGDYCVCTVDMSRGGVTNEKGLYYEELAQIFINKGAKFAYSLDGGGSAQTVIGKRQLNPIYEGSAGRSVPTVIEFVISE